MSHFWGVGPPLSRFDFEILPIVLWRCQGMAGMSAQISMQTS